MPASVPGITVAFLGNFRWRHCSENAFAAALRSLGATVVPLQEDKVTVGQIEDAAMAADLLLFTRTWGCHDPEQLLKLWGRLNSEGTPTVSYHLDLYVGLEREASIDGDPFWQTDWVFHPDGSPDTHDTLTRLGINHHVLPPAVAATECFAGTYRSHDFPHSVVFVGSALPYGHATEWPFRDQMVTHLAATYPGEFGHYGPGGLRTVRNGLTGDDDHQLNDLYATALVTVGDCIDRPGYVTDRLPETLGRGGLLVFPRTPTVDAFGYEPGVHYLAYQPADLDSLDAAIETGLALPAADQAQIRAAAIEHTAAHHTYTHRMATMLDIAGIAS